MMMQDFVNFTFKDGGKKICLTEAGDLLRLSGVRGNCFLVENGSLWRVLRRSSRSRPLAPAPVGLVIRASAN